MKRLRIWLVNPYGPLPAEGWRDYSFITFGQVLAEAGHDVVWWTSNFSHHFKRFRSRGWADVRIRDGFTVRLVPTPGYRRNIGLGRVFRDAVFAVRTYLAGRAQDPPDLVLYSESPLCLGLAGPALAAYHRAPLVYDQMDLWPELIVRALPAPVRPLAQVLLWPVYRRRRSIYQRLDGVIALARPYLDAVLGEIPAARRPPAVVIYNGIQVAAFRAAMAGELPASVAVALGGGKPRAVFAGSLGPSYDIPVLIEAAGILARDNVELQILVAGDGPQRALVAQAASRLPNLSYLGSLAPPVLAAVYGRCDIGLACYSARSNVEMPDKFYDYTAAGLAVVNSLGGEVAQWIRQSDIGLQYAAGDAVSLAGALRTLATQEAALRGYRERSARLAPEFCRDVQHRALAALVETVANGPRDDNGAAGHHH